MGSVRGLRINLFILFGDSGFEAVVGDLLASALWNGPL